MKIETRFIQRIAEELELSPTQVEKGIELLISGATPSFVAHYRKDVTGNLQERQLETIAERNAYFVALTGRREAVRKTLGDLGVLTDDMAGELNNCFDRTEIEDIFLPYRKRQRGRASTAVDQGLAPLADFLMRQELRSGTILEAATSFATPENKLATAEEALQGAVAILTERVTMDREARTTVREKIRTEGVIASFATKNAEGKKTKYSNYNDHSEPLASIPSHRFLAIQRGVKDGLLGMELRLNDAVIEADLVARFIQEDGSPFTSYITSAVTAAYRNGLRPSLEGEAIAKVRAKAEEEAIRVCRENAENLLLSPPAGAIPVIGVNVDIKGQIIMAAVDPSGAFQAALTAPEKGITGETDAFEEEFANFIAAHGVQGVAIGNGTGGREVASFVRRVIGKRKMGSVFCVFVSEAGSSAYATSEVGVSELPDMDPAIRKAITSARRLQDPLSEFVKIDPKHTGVGQYQHDVDSRRLREALTRTVVSCVNRVGVDLNKATASLLSFVSGIQPAIAKSIVEKRMELGGFNSREQLHAIEGIGPRVFEQCAGFIRVNNGVTPLDGTAIHPEAYELVAAIAESIGKNPADLIGKPETLEGVDLAAFHTETLGPLSVQEIRHELAKPNRDPRTIFRAPRFDPNVHAITDLQEGMMLEGAVTNVTDFGVFVDIGVNQDGLVHLSELANRFVRDPRSVAKVGDVVRVRVIKVDRDVPRVSLSMKTVAPSGGGAPHRGDRRPAGGQTDGAPGAYQGPPRGRRTSQDSPSPAAPGAAPAEQQGERARRPQGAPARGREHGRTQEGERAPRVDRSSLRDRDRARERDGAGGGEHRPRTQAQRPGGSERSSASRDQQQQAAQTPALSGTSLINTQLAEQLSILKEKFGGE